MNRAATTINSLFIAGLHFRRQAESVIELAKSAYGYKRFDIVGHAGATLTEASRVGDYRWAGLYWQAIALNNSDADGRARAEAMFETVAEGGTNRYRVKALTALGCNRFQQGRISESLAFYKQAAALCNDYESALVIGRMEAVVRSYEGNHKQALDRLQNLYSVARRAEAPSEYYAYLNSLSVELIQADKHDAARNVSRIVCASPFASVNSEYFETLRDAQQDRVSMVSLAGLDFPQVEIIAFPIKSIVAEARGRIMDAAYAPERTEDELLKMAGAVERIAFQH